MVSHFLSRSSSPARNFINRLRNCKSLPANLQENAAKSHHSQPSSAPNPYSSSFATHSRFFSARSLKESGNALLYKETTAGDRKKEGNLKMDANLPILILVYLPLCATAYLIGKQHGAGDRVKPVSFGDLSKLLEAGNVDRILVTDSLAIVYVTRHTFIPGHPLKFMIDIESPKSFTEKLEKTRAALRIPLLDYVPVTYVDAMNEESKF